MVLLGLILALSPLERSVGFDLQAASGPNKNTCGDGILEPGEECDDSNLVAGDGCSPDCIIESCLITTNGDMNNTNTVTSADLIHLVGYCFKGRSCPLPCCAAGDVNCSGAVAQADVIVMVNFLFKDGLPPCDICANSSMAAACI